MNIMTSRPISKYDKQMMKSQNYERMKVILGVDDDMPEIDSPIQNQKNRSSMDAMISLVEKLISRLEDHDNKLIMLQDYCQFLEKELCNVTGKEFSNPNESINANIKPKETKKFDADNYFNNIGF